MKNLSHKMLSYGILSFFIATVIVIHLTGEIYAQQPIKIDKWFSNSQVIFPFVKNERIYRLAISGSIQLYKDNSLIRVILVGDDFHEYLVYEAYPLIVDTNSVKIIDECEETCIIEGIAPHSLKIELIDASLQIDEMAITDYPPSLKMETAEAQKQTKEEQDADKIKRLNENIKKKGLKWTAGETPISKLSYEEKKKLFGGDKVPNLQGFEYYKGEIFEIKSENNITKNTVSLRSTGIPDSWDWRDFHGENWLTPVKDQGSAGTCWAHSNLGTLEAQINLFYNQHLDVDLSEQMLVDCANAGPIEELSTLPEECTGDNMCYPGYNYCKFIYIGIADESCDPYAQRGFTYNPSYCDYDHVCSDWNQRIWTISDFHDYKFVSDRGTPNCPNQTMDLPEEEYKKILFERGPLNSAITSWGHAMVLVGYEKDPDDGQTIWIFKNSWGTEWGEQGYVRIKVTLENMGWGSLPIGPFVPPMDMSYWPDNFTGEINCVDNDNDGYYNWGISQNIPSSCPDNIPYEKDCDDSNPNLGPFDTDGSCVELFENQPPTAICQDVTVSTEPGLCSADASVDDSSFDPDGDEITLVQEPEGPYDLGDTEVTLTVTDDNGATDTCDATVTVIDEEDLVISSVTANPNKLWPPNHKMVPVVLTVDATDNCDSVCQIVLVESNEPVNGLGDGNTSPDWIITGDLTVKLRAERSGTGSGRIYTITVECADSSGNSSTDTAMVTGRTCGTSINK